MHWFSTQTLSRLAAFWALALSHTHTQPSGWSASSLLVWSDNGLALLLRVTHGAVGHKGTRQGYSAILPPPSAKWAVLAPPTSPFIIKVSSAASGGVELPLPSDPDTPFLGGGWLIPHTPSDVLGTLHRLFEALLQRKKEKRRECC